MRILQCLGGLNMGGAETMIMNVYREIDKNKVQFDFIVQGQEKGFYENEAISLGAKLFHITQRSKGFFKSHLELYRIVKYNNYKIVHFHTQNAFLTSLQIIISKIAGADKIIVHCHSSMDWRSGILKKAHLLFRPVIYFLSDVRLSCGKDAAKWLYGGSDNVTIVPLPVACEKYKYSFEKQVSMKKEWGFEGKTIYIHVGRFSDVKNHVFLIDIFNEITKLIGNSRLLLIGDGDLRSSIQEKVNDLGLKDKVMFAGNVLDVYNYLIVSDALLFPSKYEGFPTVVLEAQAAGLKCFISDSITEKIAVTDAVDFLSLKSSAKDWAKYIVNNLDNNDRVSYNAKIKETYGINKVVKIFEDIYSE